VTSGQIYFTTVEMAGQAGGSNEGKADKIVFELDELYIDDGS